MAIAAVSSTELNNDWMYAALRVQAAFNVAALAASLPTVHALTPVVISGGEQSALRVLRKAISASLVAGGKDPLPKTGVARSSLGWKYILPKIISGVNTALNVSLPYTLVNATYVGGILHYTSGQFLGFNGASLNKTAVATNNTSVTFTVPSYTGSGSDVQEIAVYLSELPNGAQSTNACSLAIDLAASGTHTISGSTENGATILTGQTFTVTLSNAGLTGTGASVPVHAPYNGTATSLYISAYTIGTGGVVVDLPLVLTN